MNRNQVVFLIGLSLTLVPITALAGGWVTLLVVGIITCAVATAIDIR